MRLLVSIAAVALALLFAAATRADAPEPGRAVTGLVASYAPPSGAPGGDAVRDRAWTYDSAVTATALAADGELDAAGALLDRLQELQRPDGALEFSYAVSGADGGGPLRTGVQAWVGLAALQWRVATCSGRHDALLRGLAGWLLGRRMAARGLLDGGPDVSWASTEHNLEARAFFSGLAGVLDGSGMTPCPPGLDGLDQAGAQALSARLRDTVDGLDASIEEELLARDGGLHFRQGLHDDARPLDVQAFGALWLAARGRPDDARAVLSGADATMRVTERRVPGATESFTGYKPFADAWGPDVLWMEGTMQVRHAKARLGLPVADLDDSAARWAALTAPGMPLQADRTDGGDYHAWPAAGAAAWMRLAYGPFSLLG